MNHFDVGMLFLFQLQTMCEKNTQTLIDTYFKSYGIKIHMEGNKEIFENDFPDGWIITNKQLFIIEAKQRKNQWNEAKTQLIRYMDKSKVYVELNKLSVVPIFAFGVDNLSMYVIKDFENPFTTPFDSSMITNNHFLNHIETDNDPHIFNQYIYDNFPQISSSERIKIIISTLLCLHLKIELIEPLYLKVFEIEKSYGFESEYTFINKQPYIQALNECFRFFKNIDSSNIPNILFKCFVEISKWSFKTNSGKQIKEKLINDEGAVFTPPDIVDLMTELIPIKSVDVVCDPCCGSGSFIYSALKHTKNVIGNEIAPERVLMTKHGLIINDVFDANDRIKQFDYMNPDYQPNFDWLLMNPPYNHQIEQKACLKFMKLAKKGGVIIIPINNFRIKDFKENICKYVHPTDLIILNNKVFYPVANVQTAILVFYNKSFKNLQFNIDVYDFTDDGYEIKIGHGRKYKESKEMSLIGSIVDMHGDWLNVENMQSDETIDEILKNLKSILMHKYILEYSNKVNAMNLDFGQSLPQINYTLPMIDRNNVKMIKFSDVFEFINTPKITCESKIPLYGATKENEPQKMVNYYHGDSTPEAQLLTINSTGNGGCGICHLMSGKFAVSSRYVFKIKNGVKIRIDLKITSLMVSLYLHDMMGYSRNKVVKKTEFNEIIPIYIINNS